MEQTTEQLPLVSRTNRGRGDATGGTLSPCSREDSGFTLVELVVVSLLLALLSTTLYGALSTVIRGKEAAEQTFETERTAHAVFGRLLNELASRSLTVLTPRQNTAGGSSSGDDAAAAGGTDSGTDNPRGRAYLWGVHQQNGEFSRDRIRFVTANGSQAFLGTLANLGPVELEYRLEKPQDSGIGDDNGFTLVREESPALPADNSDKAVRRVVLPVAERIISLQIRYLRNGKWQSDWRPQLPTLPEAIEVTLGILMPNPGADRTAEQPVEYYRTAYPIQRRTRTTDSRPQ